MNDFLENDPSESLLGEIDFYCSKCEKDQKKPTLTGLTFHLGLCDKKELLEYKGKHERIIKRALLRLEMVLEENIYSKDFDALSYFFTCFFARLVKTKGKSMLLIEDLVQKAVEGIEGR